MANEELRIHSSSFPDDAAGDPLLHHSTPNDALLSPKSAPNLPPLNKEQIKTLLLDKKTDYTRLSDNELNQITDYLKTNQKKAEKRNTAAKILAACNGFWDGAFDLAAIGGILGAAAATVVGVTLAVAIFSIPIVGWILFGITLFAVVTHGVHSAYKAYKQKKEDLAKDQEKFNRAIKNIETIKQLRNQNFEYKLGLKKANFQTIITQLFAGSTSTPSKIREKITLNNLNKAYNNILEKFKERNASCAPTNHVEQNLPNPNSTDKEWETFDTVEAASRHGRNAIMLGVIMAAPITYLLGIVAAWPAAVGAAIICALKVPPRFLEYCFIDLPRNSEQEIVDSVLSNTRLVVKNLISHNPPLPDTDGQNPITLKINLELESEFEAAATRIISDAALQEDLDKNIVEEHATEDISITNNLGKKFLDEAETYAREAKARSEKGLRYARNVGWIMGALHPIAWFAIAAIIILPFFPAAPMIPVLFSGLAVAVILAPIIGHWTAKRAEIRERDQQRKELEAIENYRAVLIESQQLISKTSAQNRQEQGKQNWLEKQYNEYQEKLAKLSLSPEEKKAKLAKLTQIYQAINEEKAALEAKRNQNQDFSTLFNNLANKKQEPSNAWSTWQKSLRDGRDTNAFFTKPLSAISKIAYTVRETAQAFGGFFMALGLGIITLGYAIRKKITIDDRRDAIIADCEKKTNFLEEERRKYLTEQTTSTSIKLKLQARFQQEATSALYNSPTNQVLFYWGTTNSSAVELPSSDLKTELPAPPNSAESPTSHPSSLRN